MIRFSEMSNADCDIIGAIENNPGLNVSLTYSVYKGFKMDGFLQMDSSWFEGHRGKYKFEYWDVSVGGVPTDDFEVEDYRITELNGVSMDSEDSILEAFDDDTEIKVRVKLYHAL